MQKKRKRKTNCLDLLLFVIFNFFLRNSKQHLCKCLHVYFLAKVQSGCDTFCFHQKHCGLCKQRGIQAKLNQNKKGATVNSRWLYFPLNSGKLNYFSISLLRDYWPLLCASSCDKEFTATLHSAQYNSFLALSSSVSGLDGLFEAEMPTAPETGVPDPTCSELVRLLPQPGEEEVGGTSGGVGVGMRGHTDGTGESMGGVGGVWRGGRGPGASKGPFIRDIGRVSSKKKKPKQKQNRQTKEIIMKVTSIHPLSSANPYHSWSLPQLESNTLNVKLNN